MARPYHFELGAIDPARAAVFYKAVFGWTIERWNGPTEYYLVRTGAETEPGIDGGISPSRDGTVCTINTIGVHSLDTAVEAVIAHGGSVVSPPNVIPGVGSLAYCKDTEGNIFGLMEEERPLDHVEMGEKSGV